MSSVRQPQRLHRFAVPQAAHVLHGATWGGSARAAQRGAARAPARQAPAKRRKPRSARAPGRRRRPRPRAPRRPCPDPAPRQAERLAAKGATFLDVRPAYQFEREHVEGAVNVPMFRKVAGSSNWDNLKRVVMRFGLAMEATGAPPGS